MSFVYSFYNCFSPFPQTIYTLYTQPDLQNMLQPLVLMKNQSQQVSNTNNQNSRLNQLPDESICQEDSKSFKNTPNFREKKSSKRQRSTKKDEPFGRRKQNKDRNMMSYIFKGYVQYVFQQRGMLKVIEQYSTKSSLDNGVSNFYEFMIEKFPNAKSYLGIRYIHGLLREQSSPPAMIQILSLTLRLYLKQVFPMIIIQGPQTSRRQRLVLLRKGRGIVSALFKG